MELSPLEKQVLNAMAQADRERPTIEAQIDVAAVISREYTNVGFFTKLAVPDAVGILDLDAGGSKTCPTDLLGHPSLAAGASFILWIKEGRLVTLEGFTNHGDWPADEADFRVAV